MEVEPGRGMAPIAQIRLSSATSSSPQDMNRERSTLNWPYRVVESIPSGAGALVMGTGIVSIDLALLGQQPLSLVPLVVAGLAWVALGLLLAGDGGCGPGDGRQPLAAPATAIFGSPDDRLPSGQPVNAARRWAWSKGHRGSHLPRRLIVSW
jgi:hypothetical protein